MFATDFTFVGRAGEVSMVKVTRFLIVLALLGAGTAAQSAAQAQPVPPGFYGGPGRFAPYGFRGPYGFRRFGPYGYRRFPRRLSYGTGYHGRGTATGGPAGGLPNRN